MSVELETPITQTEAKPDIKDVAASLFYGKEVPKTETPVAEVTTETTTDNTEEIKEVDTPAGTPNDDPTVTTPDLSFLKELGFESVEALKEALKKQPEVQQSFFIPEEKEDEITDILYTKKQLKALESETSEEKIIKAYIKFTNPEFNDKDVDAEYKETYSLSEDAEFDEEKKQREEKKIKQKIAKDVVAAKEFFAKKKEELKLPEYKQEAAPTDNNDADYENQLAEYRQKFKDGITGLKSANPIQITHKVKLDDKTEVDIPIKYELDEKGLNTIKTELLADGGYDNLLTRRHYANDNYNAEQIAKDFYVLENLDKIIDSAVTQAVEKFRVEQLTRAKNISETTPTDKGVPQELQQDSKVEALRKVLFKTP